MVVILVAVEAVVAGTTRPVAGAGAGLLLVGGFHLIVATLAPVVPGCGDVELAGLVSVVTGVAAHERRYYRHGYRITNRCRPRTVITARQKNGLIRIALDPAIISRALVTYFWRVSLRSTVAPVIPDQPGMTGVRLAASPAGNDADEDANQCADKDAC